MSDVDLVLLVDADPPSDVGGGRGFYPAAPGGAPPDAEVVAARLAAIERFVANEAGGAAVVTVHTSPRFRDDLLDPPFADRFRALAEAGATLAAHPHEDRADGGTLYGDLGHLRRVLAGQIDLAARRGLRLTAFRSGGFAFHPDLPAVLDDLRLGLDLSPAPGLVDPARNVAWAADAGADGRLGPVACVPLGWDGDGTDLGANYLFCEKLDEPALHRVWDDVRRRAERGGPRLVNLLCHGFGLIDAALRRRATAFLRHARAHGGRLVDARALAAPALLD